jgi:hypothetical protein
MKLDLNSGSLTARWTLEEPQQAVFGNPFQNAGWHEVKADSGVYRQLLYSDGAEPLGRLGVRDIAVLGSYRRWALLGEPVATTSRPIDQAQALTALLAYAKSEGVDVLDCQFNMARWSTEAVEAVLPPDCHEPFGTYLVDLTVGEEAARSGFSSNHKRQLKQALKAGLSVRRSVEIEPLVSLLTAVYGRTDRKVPFSPEYLARLLAMDSDSLVAVTVESDNAIEMVLLVPHDGGRGYFLHGAARPGGVRGAAVLGHFEAMRCLMERQVPAYDLGGARPWHDDPRLQGIAEFKRRFGGPFEAVSRFQVPITRKGRLIHRTLPQLGQRLKG